MGASARSLAIGLMSGTSMDGIDAAMIRTDGLSAVEPVAAVSRSYDDMFRQKLRDAVGHRGSGADIARELTARHVEIVEELIASSGVARPDVEIVGFHGHTVFHDPDNGQTVQIGDGRMLAAEAGIDVVTDFRSNDVAAGGQGAPFAPLAHAVFAPDLRPVCFLNIGGVANLTWIGAAADPGRVDVFDHLCAFDTGPGGALVDDWTYRHTGQPYDKDGALAASGQVDADVLGRLLQNRYFDAPPPKSLDRDAFDISVVEGLSAADGAATLTAFTAETIARAACLLPAVPDVWLVTGGGRHNPLLMEMLGGKLDAAVKPTEAWGIDGDVLEAQAFAYLAVRSLRGLPLSGPTTTGVSEPTLGGRLFRAA